MRAVVAVYVAPVPDGLMNASEYSSSASQLRFSASASCANGDECSIAAQPPLASTTGSVAPRNATCSNRYTMVASRIEPITPNGTLRPGFLASPARFTGLWKPLKLNTMPLIATAVRIADMLYACGPPCAPTWKFSGWNEVAISAIAVSAGTTSLYSVIHVLVFAKRFTLQ